MPEKVVTLILKVDLQCCRCKTKIQKVLCKLQKCVPIQLIGYDEKNNVVIVSGPFNPECVSRKLRCMASCKVIKDINIKPDSSSTTDKKSDSSTTDKKSDSTLTTDKKSDSSTTDQKTDPSSTMDQKSDSSSTTDQKPGPPPPIVLKVDWQWPSSPPPWSTCCVHPCPCYQAHHGCSCCCSCDKVVDQPPQPYPYPAYYYPLPPVYGGGHCQGIEIVCEQDPPYLCNIM